jgi:pyruvate dehydrogenase E2 component (dihydrolipoamide acetyltransferase)
MANTVVLPKLGQTVEEATIVKWHKKTGDKVKKGEVICEIETDKAVLEVESFYEGILLKELLQEGDTVPVGTVIAFIGKKGEAIPKTPRKPEKHSIKTPEKEKKDVSAPAKTETAGNTANNEVSDSVLKPVKQPGEMLTPAKKPVSPRARKLIKEKAISASRINGSGPNGRVIEKDVITYLKQNNYSSIRITPAAKKLAAEKEIDIFNISLEPGKRITVQEIREAVAEKPQPLSKIRKLTGERLTKSFSTTPHFFTTVETEMSGVLDIRKKLKKESKNKYSLTHFLIQSVCAALKQFRVINSSTDGKTVSWHSHVNIGIAVDLDGELVVPVLHNVEKLSMPEIKNSTQELIIKARNRNLTPDEMSNGTFTISNMGMLNVENFTAIINPGESAILAVSSIIHKPIVKNNTIAIGNIMKMTLSADHRIIDGATAAKFTNRIRENLEDTKKWRNLI